MQQVNLYQPVAQSQAVVTARSAMRGMVVIVIALLCMWGYAWWQLRGTQREADVARAQSEARRKLEAVRTADLDALSPEELDQRITALNDAVAMKTLAVQILGAETTKTADFSARLAALSRQHLDGVWLEQLTLGAGRDAMSLTGAALAADLVPRYLQSLAADPALQGGAVDTFLIDRPPTRTPDRTHHLRFRAATRALQPPPTDPAEG